jgi:hypothetical protein
MNKTLKRIQCHLADDASTNTKATRLIILCYELQEMNARWEGCLFVAPTAGIYLRKYRMDYDEIWNEESTLKL